MKKRTTQDNSQMAQTSNTRPTMKGGLQKSLLFLCLLMASMGAWAQTLDGYYKFRNRNNNAYYLSVSNNNYNNNEATPYLLSSNASNKTGDDAIWAVYNYNGSKILVHATDGRIVVTHNSEQGPQCVHLESLNVTNGNNQILFTQSTVTQGRTTYYRYKPNTSNTNVYLNAYGGTDQPNDIGLYQNDNGGNWSRTNATPPTIAAPTISSSNRGRTVSLDCTNNYARIYYTTDGTNPTTSSTRYTGSFNITETKTIKAIAYVGFINAAGTFVDVSHSNVTTQQVAVLTTPTTLTFANASPTVTPDGWGIQLPAVTLKANETTVTGRTITYSGTGCNVNNNGTVTGLQDAGATITASFAGDADYAPSSATYIITGTNHDALNETIIGSIAITPATADLDLGGAQEYSIPASVSATTRTCEQYFEYACPIGAFYKYEGSEWKFTLTKPKTNENTGATVNLTRVNWTYSGGQGQYFQPTATNNKVTLTRTDQKTDHNQVFTITANATYGSADKTATAKVTILKTVVDITNLYAGSAINLQYGEAESIAGHFSWQPNSESAGETYKNFTYTSQNENVATVDANGNVSATGPGSTTITVQSKKQDGTNGPNCAVTVNVNLVAPTISINGSGNVTITHPADGVTILYTTNGTDPTATTGTVYNGAFGPVANETTVKAVAVANSRASAVSSGLYATSGVSGTKVILNDYEDHNWTYYQPNGGVDASYAYPDQLCSPYPRNVKITYLGNGRMFTDADGGTTVAATGVQVSRYETENTFVYYKTLERDANDRFPYELIPNPFSKRPVRTQDATTKWRGFYGWRIKSVTGGTIYDNRGTQRGVGYIFTTEYDIISFQPTDNAKTNANNATSMEVEFEAVWARAYRVTCNANAVSTAIENAALTDNSYERNFVVVNTGTGGAAISNNNQKPVTIMMVEPDGSDDYRTTTRYIATTTTDIIARNTLKIEWCNIRARYISANGKDMVLGRGLMQSGAKGSYGTPGTNYCGTYVSGIGAGTTATAYTTNITHTFRIESGVYQDVNFLSRTNQGLRGTTSSTIYQYGVIGNDYERAGSDGKTLNTSTRMRIYDHVSQGVAGNDATFTTGNHNNASRKTFDLVIKSGYVGSRYDNDIASGAWDANYEQVVYIGVSTSTRTPGYRTLTLEGGNIAGIAGGVDRWGTSSETGRDYNATRPSAIIRLKGSEDYPVVRGPIYAGAANAPTYGIRSVIATGGLVKGWVAGGCNGNDNQQGRNFGPSYVYIGGNTQVNSNNANTTFGAGKSIGGMVYAAGSGQSSNSYSGRIVWGTHLAIADECYIERNAFGGGNYGYSDDSTYVYISGGHVKGKVFGGASLRGGKTVDIVMSGGQIDGGLYGGSNENGTISENVKMYIFGGQIGTPSVPANIHGGGYGDQTVVSGNVEMTLGNLADEKGAKIYGNVYGGSALGTTGGNTKHTYVTVNRGNITGNVFGGGMGEAGSNTKGVVTGAIKVDVYGTDPKPSDDTYALYGVYGGGDLAPYADTPIVTVHNCDNSIEYVYGGGNATSVGATDVTIYGGNKIGNVFGGGNGQVRAANVNGNTNVKIYGGTIGNVYGGSNTNGTIGGTINVNVNSQAEPSKEACSMIIDNVYSGGNKAPSNVGNLTIGCTGTDGHISNIYGGANQANVTGDINLLIKGGHIGNVFGGNNNSGSVIGTITVTVDWDGSCGTNYLENVYGGGNLAKYATLQGKKDYPKVFIRNATIEENVFGGGKGDANDPNDRTKGQVTGNPQVKIGTSTTDESGNGHNIANHEITIKKSVYGGGNAAPVVGNTNVLIDGSALNKVININEYVFGGGLGETAAIKKVDASNGGDTHVKLVDKVNVSLNVYGGGNGGAVEGNTEVIIGEDN